MHYPPPRRHIYFASYLARTVRHCTIKLYLAAVRNLHITAGYSNLLKGKSHLHKVLRGILRYQGEQHIRRQPFNPRVLSATRPVLQSWLSPRDFSMIWAAFNLAFLRCSEFTCNGVRKFRPLFDLFIDIAPHPTLACPQRMTVQLIYRQKQIFYRRGHSLTIASTSSTLCAVPAMREYFLLARPQQGPLFHFQSGSFRTRGAVSHLLRDSSRVPGLPYQSIKGHSFRIGAPGVGCHCCRHSRLAYLSHGSLALKLLPALYKNSSIKIRASSTQDGYRY